MPLKLCQPTAHRFLTQDVTERFLPTSGFRKPFVLVTESLRPGSCFPFLDKTVPQSPAAVSACHAQLTGVCRALFRPRLFEQEPAAGKMVQPCSTRSMGLGSGFGALPAIITTRTSTPRRFSTLLQWMASALAISQSPLLSSGLSADSAG